MFILKQAEVAFDFFVLLKKQVLISKYFKGKDI